MTKEEWDLLEIPDFLKRPSPVGAPTSPTPPPQTAATAPDVNDCGGDLSGKTPSTGPTSAVAPDDFSRFATVTVTDTETRIRQEADRRWRNWTMSREHPKRPRRSSFEKAVRAEYKRAGLI